MPVFPLSLFRRRQSPEQLAPDAPLAVVGDIHGRADLLDRLLEILAREVGPDCALVFVGDYVDRGERSAEVLDQLDGVFFVLKWGGTNLDIAKRVLRMDPRLRDKCYGAFLNLFDATKARAYTGYEGYRYHRSYYNRYHRDS